MTAFVVDLASLSMGDVAQVGGKNASLGEMIANLSELGVQVPGGFATTTAAFWHFLQSTGLKASIQQQLDALDNDNIAELQSTGQRIRQSILEAEMPQDLQAAVRQAYAAMGDNPNVAVRSSATAEDLPDASFAGQQETYLNINGIEAVMQSIKLVFASLYNDRAISYRVHQGFAHNDVALSAGVQRMVRSDLASSGVMFSIDTESGFEQTVFITSSYGLGETVVQGAVNPDEFYVYKTALAAGRPALLSKTLGSKKIRMEYSDAADPREAIRTVAVTEEQQQRFSISDQQVHDLARMAVTIEQHYGRPMDIEWALDGQNGALYIVQARPETVQSQSNQHRIERYSLNTQDEPLIKGRAVGQRVGQGPARIIEDLSQMDVIQPGDVLVTDMTDPDWEPIMKKASAIVTNRGGRTCHAAIIAREMGIPALVGCGNATEKLTADEAITVSCCEGDSGFVYAGLLPYEHRQFELDAMPELPLKVMMNIANPERALAFSRIPNAGIGLARLEFIINTLIGIHPRALLEFDQVPAELQVQIQQRIAGYADPVEFYVAKLTQGISMLAAAFAPHPVIVRMSDFKSNEYAHLLGGRLFEPDEENPMIGFRGASRYISDDFAAAFALECQAIRRVRESMGLDNVQIMIPFVRTLQEAEGVIERLKQHGLERGKAGLKIIMMCEIPSNVLLADEFLQHFDGFSIGSNDLTQLTLGLDRDSGLVAESFDERNPAVKKLLESAIQSCRKADKYVGICGQGPSDHPDLASWLLHQGINSVSLNPDTVIDTWLQMATSLKAPH